MTPLRILFLGENWYGSCARACAYALRRLGHDVLDVDCQTFYPHAQTLGGRILRRALTQRWSVEYNEHIIRTAKQFRPEVLLAFKGQFVESRTIRMLRDHGVRCYNYYPDRVMFARGTPQQSAIPEYDCFFDTKRQWDGNTREWLHVRERVFVPHGYDPDVHHPTELTECDRDHYGCDVSLVANYSPRKFKWLVSLIAAKPDLDLKIWGEGWPADKRLVRFLQNHSLTGDQYARALQATRVNLAIMGVNAVAADTTTTRTYEIPACGAFMLHERSEEVLELYEEDCEMACFSSADELIDKTLYYVRYPLERLRIARAGYRRCVPAYSYDNRMKAILGWHMSCSLVSKALVFGGR